jgi:hypothetical protein
MSGYSVKSPYDLYFMTTPNKNIFEKILDALKSHVLHLFLISLIYLWFIIFVIFRLMLANMPPSMVSFSDDFADKVSVTPKVKINESYMVIPNALSSDWNSIPMWDWRFVSDEYADYLNFKHTSTVYNL